MKKIIMTAAICGAALSSEVASAQAVANEKTTIYELNQSKLHVYQSGDAMGDVSFIVEGAEGLVILEQPLFWENIKEFNAYVESLAKPIDKVVANYHFLGLADYDPANVVMPESMPAFISSEAAQGMLGYFKQSFGESADFRPYTKAEGIAIPSTQNWAGVDFKFTQGAVTDFPAASILIDGKAYYTHFSPAKAHANALQVKSAEAIDSVLAELKNIKASGAEYIFGSHGPAATQDDIDFQIEYFSKMQSLRSTAKTADEFTKEMQSAYPGLYGDITPVAAELYK